MLMSCWGYDNLQIQTNNKSQKFWLKMESSITFLASSFLVSLIIKIDHNKPKEDFLFDIWL